MELRGNIRQGEPARIVNVASAAHRHGTIDFNDLQGERSYRPMRI
jgi:hypothetical protein